MWSLLISTVVFFVASVWLKRKLEAQGLPAGWTRTLLILVLASVASFAVEAVVDRLIPGQADPLQQALRLPQP